MIALAFFYIALHSSLSTSRLALTSPSSPLPQFSGPRDSEVAMDSESNPSAGSRWAEAWVGQGLSEKLSARLCAVCHCFVLFLFFCILHGAFVLWLNVWVCR